MARSAGEDALRDQLPISDYGVIGDLRTVALVGIDGSIDWCCLPRFDSPSVFAGLLDPDRGGRFQVSVAGAKSRDHQYLVGTAILSTSFETPDGSAQVIDFMPVPAAGPNLLQHSEIHRQVLCTTGFVDVVLELMPRFDYATSDTYIYTRKHGILTTDGIDEAVALSTSEPLEWRIADGTAIARTRLDLGDSLMLVLRYDDDDVRPIEVCETAKKLAGTMRFWRTWTSNITYKGKYVDAVLRAAVTLKLLCYAETGAMVAAPTTSLPEDVGGERNWDYRYAWLRDSCFALYSFHVLGLHEEGDHFMTFVKRVCRAKSASHLQTMYGVDGRRDLSESLLTHLSGYRGSKPVRVGNSAATQLQLDIYGEVLQTAFIWAGYYEMTEGTWAVLKGLVDFVADNWRREDSGLWEDRTALKQYVFSKVMCWVALDRGVRLAESQELEGDIERWRREADMCRAEVLEKGYSDRRGSFVRCYGGEDLDASALVIPMVKFLHRSDSRIKQTVRTIARELATGNGTMVYRYRSDDGLPGEEGVFSICTFWLAQCLAMVGDYSDGERLFEEMLKCANRLGLYSEELHPKTGEFLGNFPQGLTHIALINCAAVLERLRPN